MMSSPSVHAARVLAPDTGQRRPTPQPDRIPQTLHRAIAVCRAPRPLSPGEQLPEDAEIQRVRRRTKLVAVPRGTAHGRRGVPGGFQRLPQSVDVRPTMPGAEAGAMVPQTASTGPLASTCEPSASNSTASTARCCCGPSSISSSPRHALIGPSTANRNRSSIRLPPPAIRIRTPGRRGRLLRQACGAPGVQATRPARWCARFRTQGQASHRRQRQILPLLVATPGPCPASAATRTASAGASSCPANHVTASSCVAGLSGRRRPASSAAPQAGDAVPRTSCA